MIFGCMQLGVHGSFATPRGFGVAAFYEDQLQLRPYKTNIRWVKSMADARPNSLYPLHMQIQIQIQGRRVGGMCLNCWCFEPALSCLRCCKSCDRYVRTSFKCRVKSVLKYLRI